MLLRRLCWPTAECPAPSVACSACKSLPAHLPCPRRARTWKEATGPSLQLQSACSCCARRSEATAMAMARPAHGRPANEAEPRPQRQGGGRGRAIDGLRATAAAAEVDLTRQAEAALLSSRRSSSTGRARGG